MNSKLKFDNGSAVKAMIPIILVVFAKPETK